MMDIITSKIGNFNQQFCNILVDSFIASVFNCHGISGMPYKSCYVMNNI